MKPELAYSYLSSLAETLKRRPGEKEDTKYIANFEGVKIQKQLSLWRILRKTRLKLEYYDSKILGVEITECVKNANLDYSGSRLCDGMGVCVYVENKNALKELIFGYFDIDKKEEEFSKKDKEVENRTTSKNTNNLNNEKPKYKDYGEAPNDNLTELNTFARKVSVNATVDPQLFAAE